ncbi:hypothetical protein BH10PSE12_BH10PSE12_04410 [soil metagenome]
MFRPFRAMLFAGLAVLAATGSSSDALSPGFMRGAKTWPVGAENSLSAMTYNIRGLPWPIAMGRTQALAAIADRLANMRRAGVQPHIVLLQEAFTPEAAQIAARAGYAHVVAGPDAGQPSTMMAGGDDIAFLADARWDRGERMGKQLGSGLLILSDYSVIAIDRLAFPDFACAGFDCLANKGVLIAHLAVPGSPLPVSIVNTHLNARKAAGVPVIRTQHAFARQVDLMARFIADHVPEGQPMILGGDMNIGKDAQRAQAFFARFARAGLSFVTPRLAGAHRALAEAACADEGARRDLMRASQHAKDWLFARDARHAPMPLAAAHVPFGTEPDGIALSDHVGYVIDYRGAAPLHVAQTRRNGAML